MVSTRSGRMVSAPPAEPPVRASRGRKKTSVEDVPADVVAQVQEEQVPIQPETAASPLRVSSPRQQQAPNTPFGIITEVKEVLSPRSVAKSPSKSGQHTPDHAKTISRLEEVQTVSKIPLPADDEVQQEYASSDEESTPTAPQAQVQQHSQPSKGKGAGVGIFFSFLLLLSLTAAGLTCFGGHMVPIPPELQTAAAPYCSAAQAGLQTAQAVLKELDLNILREQMEAHLHLVVSQARENFGRIQRTIQHTVTLATGSQEPASFQDVLSFAAFRALLMDGDSWTEQATDFWLSIPKQLEEKQKGAGVLVVCANAQECAAVVDNVRTSNPVALVISGSSYASPGSAGQLQADLAAFLVKHAAGVVVVTQPERLDQHALAVLNNVLSEAGNLMLDGKPITTSKALYLVLTEVTVQDGVEQDTWASSARKRLRNVLKAAATEEEDKKAIVNAFIRRLDFVAPSKAVDMQ